MSMPSFRATIMRECSTKVRSFSSKSTIYPILDRKFQTMHLAQQPDRSQWQPYRACLLYTSLQLFDLGQLLDTHLIKGILSSLVEQYFFLMFLPEFLRVAGLAVVHLDPVSYTHRDVYKRQVGC